MRAMNKDRENEIIKILLAEKNVSVKELADRLYTSMPSIRRDLASLERAHLIKRVHGGASLDASALSDTKIPFIVRELEQSSAKAVIAEKAARLVKDNDVVMLDASTSAYGVIPFLVSKKNILIITNGIKALQAAGEYGIRALSAGGELLPSCQSLVGAETSRMIKSYNADILFFSCRGLTNGGLITDFSLEENYARRTMLEQSEKRVLLCDSNKIGKKYMHTLCTAADIDYIISENKLPEGLASKEYLDTPK